MWPASTQLLANCACNPSSTLTTAAGVAPAGAAGPSAAASWPSWLCGSGLGQGAGAGSGGGVQGQCRREHTWWPAQAVSGTGSMPTISLPLACGSRAHQKRCTARAAHPVPAAAAGSGSAPPPQTPAHTRGAGLKCCEIAASVERCVRGSRPSIAHHATTRQVGPIDSVLARPPLHQASRCTAQPTCPSTDSRGRRSTRFTRSSTHTGLPYCSLQCERTAVGGKAAGRLEQSATLRCCSALCRHHLTI